MQKLFCIAFGHGTICKKQIVHSKCSILMLAALIVSMLLSMTACTGKSTEDSQESEETSPTPTVTIKAAEKTTTTKTETVTTTTKTETTTVENPFEERLTINWLVGTYSSHLYEEGRWDELELEELFNVDLKLWNIRIDSSYMEDIYMMLAAGDVPDFGYYYISGQYLMEQGLGRTVPLDMIIKYCPGYYKLLTDDPIGLLFNRVEGKEDEYYGLSMVTRLAWISGHQPLWRLDWLENLGYELENLQPMINYDDPEWDDVVFISTTKFTLDETKEILRAFTEDDPDGNGVDDTYGSAFSNGWYDCYISYCMFGFDMEENSFYKDSITGDFLPYYAISEYKEWAEYISEMLEKGYLRRLPGEENYYYELQSVWRTGQTGYMNTNNYTPTYNDSPPGSIHDKDKTARFVLTQVPGEKGKLRPYWVFNWSEGEHYPFGVTCDDKKMVRILQMINYAYFGENWLRYKWGIEGVHYKWSGEPFNSQLMFTDPEKIPVKYRGTGTSIFGQFGNVNFIPDLKVYFDYNPYTIQFYDYYGKHYPSGLLDDRFWIRPDKYYARFMMPEDKYEDFKKLKDETQLQIDAVRNDFMNRLFSGQIANIDTEWEQYIQQLYAAGLEEWMKIWNSDDVKEYSYYQQLKPGM
jgi:putative aldouronate transport system substrate-binding protein